jgi:hypothetical protein
MIFLIIKITEKSRIINVFYNKFLNSRVFFRFHNINFQFLLIFNYFIYNIINY